MRYRVFITPECEKQAEKLTATQRILSLQREIDRTQNTKRLETGLWPYLHEEIGGNRLIIEEHQYHSESLICFKHLWKHEDYEKLYRTLEPLSNVERRRYFHKHRIPNGLLDEFLKSGQPRQKVDRNELSNEERTYLSTTGYDLIHPTNTTDLVLETETWCDRIIRKWAVKKLSHFATLVVRLRQKIINLEVDDQVTIEEYAGVGVYYRHLPTLNRTILIAPQDTDNPISKVDLRGRHPELFSSDCDQRLIDRQSFRAYPSLVTFDEELWMQTQEEDSLKANLALSLDEHRLLESMTGGDSNSAKRYPLFINGRAGSGKSTILQFLFANHLYAYTHQPGSSKALNPPLYLTYSHDLMAKARITVDGILRASANTLLAKVDSKASGEPASQSSFKTVRGLFLSALPSNFSAQFSSSKFVHFNTFKVLWLKQRRFERTKVKDIRPALVWHVIRTFIKGMDVRSMGDYRRIPQDRRSVNIETFQLILDHAWTWYHRHCSTYNLWDDQDLARAVLTNIQGPNGTLRRYPGIFCDEAQDFTQLELDVLQNFLLFSHRDLHRYSYLVKNIPFAFAGDPFQTLNPTGFNWSAIKSSYHENVIQKLDPHNDAKLEFNYHELSLNYRSSIAIVKFANAIQLLRASLLNQDDLRPQESWRDLFSEHRVVYYDSSDRTVQNHIREEENLLIIVPCDEDGESVYRAKDSILSGIVDDTEDALSRLAGPVKVKGLEFDRVLLYGFGHFAATEYPGLIGEIEQAREPRPSDEDRLVWEYFLNKLYVAVSRARKQLIVVDSKVGIDEFWRILSKPKQQELLSRVSDGMWSEEQLGEFYLGTESSWSEVDDDPEQVARDYQARGRAELDTQLLRDAKSYYRKAGESKLATCCEAEALEIEGVFNEARSLYLDIGELEFACRCSWSEGNWDEIVALGDADSRVKDYEFYKGASLIRHVGTVSRDQVLGVLSELVGFTKSPRPTYPGVLVGYGLFLAKLAEHLCDRIEDQEPNTDEWDGFADQIMDISEDFEVTVRDIPAISRLFYCCGDTSTALRLWCEIEGRTNPISRRDPDWVVLAHTATKPVGERVKSHLEMGDHSGVIRVWREEGEPLKSEINADVVMSAIRVAEFSVAERLLRFVSDTRQFCHVAMTIPAEFTIESSRTILVGLMYAFDAESDWSGMVNFVENTASVNVATPLFSRWKWHKSERISAAVQVLARTQQDPSKRKARMTAVADHFLGRFFLPGQPRRGFRPPGRRQLNEIKAVFSSVEIIEVGVAFERCCHLKMASMYYDQFIRGDRIIKELVSWSDDDVELVRIRWAVCTSTRKERWRGKGVNPYQRQLELRMSEWGISTNRLSNSLELSRVRTWDDRAESTIVAPDSAVASSETGSAAPSGEATVVRASTDLDTSNTASSSDPRSGVSVDNFRFEVHIADRKLTGDVQMAKRRILLTDPITQDMVMCGDRRVTSGDLTVRSERSDSHWEIGQWGLACRLDEVDGELMVRFFSSEDRPVFGYIFPKK